MPDCEHAWGPDRIHWGVGCRDCGASYWDWSRQELRDLALAAADARARWEAAETDAAMTRGREIQAIKANHFAALAALQSVGLQYLPCMSALDVLVAEIQRLRVAGLQLAADTATESATQDAAIDTWGRIWNDRSVLAARVEALDDGTALL